MPFRFRQQWGLLTRPDQNLLSAIKKFHPDLVAVNRQNYSFAKCFRPDPRTRLVATVTFIDKFLKSKFDTMGHHVHEKGNDPPGIIFVMDFTAVIRGCCAIKSAS
jgi:hypothetical protein